MWIQVMQETAAAAAIELFSEVDVQGKQLHES